MKRCYRVLGSIGRTEDRQSVDKEQEYAVWGSFLELACFDEE